MRLRTVMVVAAFVSIAAPAARAAPQDVANSISMQVMSPYCTGVTLHDCPSDNAIGLRAKIAELSAQGWSKDRIMAWLVDQFGPEIRAVPPAAGSGLLAWLLPGAAVLIGAGLLAFVIARWTKRPRPEDPNGPGRADISDENRQRLELELAGLREEGAR